MTVRPFWIGISLSEMLRGIYSLAYIGLATNGEVISKRSVRDPLLRAIDDPLIAFTDGYSLETADIASREGL